MVNALAPWGIDPRAEELYRQMLRLPKTAPEEFVSRHGWNRDDFEASLRSLIRARLVRTDEDGHHTVIPPALAIDDLVNVEEARIASRSKQLEEARRVLRNYATEYREEVAAELPVAEILSFGQWDEKVLHSLIAAADSPIRVIYSSFEMHAETNLAQLKRVIALGRPIHALIPASVFGSPEIMTSLRSLESAQVQIRLGVDPKATFAIYGSIAASTHVDANDFRSDRLVIRIPTLLNILIAYFEELWAVATPADAQTMDDDALIITLMGAGLKDETIARQLGISLRTVRRRIADFMDEIKAETRFQAGAEARRRGLI